MGVDEHGYLSSQSLPAHLPNTACPQLPKACPRSTCTIVASIDGYRTDLLQLEQKKKVAIFHLPGALAFSDTLQIGPSEKSSVTGSRTFSVEDLSYPLLCGIFYSFSGRRYLRGRISIRSE